MAYTEINVLKSDGLFKASSETFTTLKNATFQFDTRDTKDPLFLLIDIPSGATGEYTLSFKNNEKIISLGAEKLNVIPITTKDSMDENGKVIVVLATNSGAIQNLNIKTAIVSYTAVINH